MGKVGSSDHQRENRKEGAHQSLDLFSFDTRNVVDLGWFLPEWSTSFVTRTVGPNFSFKGYSSDINHVLMPQDSQWKSSTDGKTYNWDAMPSCVAATYSRVQKAPESSGFWDVDTSNPHFSSISWLSASGISAGFPDGGSHPMANVVRQDMAAFLKRIHDLGVWSSARPCVIGQRDGMARASRPFLRYRMLI